MSDDFEVIWNGGMLLPWYPDHLRSTSTLAEAMRETKAQGIRRRLDDEKYARKQGRPSLASWWAEQQGATR